MSLWLGILSGQLTAPPFVRQRDIALNNWDFPYVTTYQWSAGFGTKYADPATAPPGRGYGTSFTSSDNAIAISGMGSPRVAVYPWNQGFGTKYADPATIVGTICRGVAINSSDSAIATVHSNSSFVPAVHAYVWNNSGFGSKYADPVSVPNASGINPNAPRGIRFRLSDAILFGSQNEIISAYTWSSAGFGTKYAAAVGAFGLASDIDFNESNNIVVIANGGNSPYISAFPWNAGFGTKYANPAITPSGFSGYGISFNSSANAVALAHTYTPFISVYLWNEGFSTRYANPAVLPAPGSGGRAVGVEFSPSGNDIAVAHWNSPFVTTYPWSSGFGAKYADPATLPYGRSNNVKFTKT